MNKIIKGRYEFYGYQKFGNIIENLQQKIRDKYPEKDHLKLIKKKIKDTFSNTVFIIDEVHNIKESNSLKVLPPLLNKVVSYSENMKLLLLSATPMFDTSNEIFFLLNLMLKNDNRPIMYSKDYMDKNGISGKKILMVHSFTEGMVTDKETIKLHDQIDLIMNLDGHGSPALKIKVYNSLYTARSASRVSGGFKLFFLEDKPSMMTPAQSLGQESVDGHKLAEIPRYINYQ